MRGLMSRSAAASVSRQMLVLAVMTCGLAACEPTVVIGQWACPASSADAGAVPAIGDPVSIPWFTGFENRDCDYQHAGGFCFHTGPASVDFVTSTAHSGEFSAAFNVTGDDTANAGQVRCVRQGVLPQEAYYGAWYYIPANVTNSGLWNLFHFAGADTPTSMQQPPLWDVSLVNGSNGQLNARVYNPLWKLGDPNPNVGDAPPAPIGSWFHLEFYLKRAKDATGEAALYQDGKRVVDFTNLITDNTNWGRWYVGNLADSLNPPDSTLYVDDVTIAATQGWTPPQ
jgi:Polysaccharide lyase